MSSSHVLPLPCSTYRPDSLRLSLLLPALNQPTQPHPCFHFPPPVCICLNFPAHLLTCNSSIITTWTDYFLPCLPVSIYVLTLFSLSVHLFLPTPWCVWVFTCTLDLGFWPALFIYLHVLQCFLPASSYNKPCIFLTSTIKIIELHQIYLRSLYFVLSPVFLLAQAATQKQVQVKVELSPASRFQTWRWLTCPLIGSVQEGEW